MPKEFSRIERLSQLMQRELALLIQQEVKDPRLGMVTVSGIHVTRDLSYAKVYVTVLGDSEQIAANLAVLNQAAGFLRSMLGRRLKVRTVPELTFLYDATMVEGNRLSALIDQAVEEDEKRARDESK